MFKCKKILALVLAIVALAVVAVPAWATEGIANGGTGIIQLSDSSSYVNMRNSASTSGAIRARLGHGTTLTVLSSTNGTTVNGSSVWYRVQIVTPAGNTNASSGQTGYVHSYYVVPGSTAPSVPNIYISSFSGYALHTSPFFTAPVVDGNVDGVLIEGRSATFEQSSRYRGWLMSGGVYMQAINIGIDPSTASLPTAKTVEKIYLYETPVVSGSATTNSIYAGRTVVVLDTTSVSGWYRIGSKNGIGWVRASKISFD